MGNDPVVAAGAQIITTNTICHEMPTTPVEVELNYLHVCNSGPLLGRYLTLSRQNGLSLTINLAEVVVWDVEQPEDFSSYHGRFIKTDKNPLVKKGLKVTVKGGNPHRSPFNS